MAPDATAQPRSGSDSGLGFALTFVHGRAVLALEDRSLGALGRVDRLEMEVPNLRFPFDLSGGPARFQHRRCQLRELTLSAAAAELATFLRSRPLAAFGLRDPEVRIERGAIRFEAQAVLGGREATFVALAAIVPETAGRVRLSIREAQVYGFLPVAAPLLVTALFSALGAETRPRTVTGPGGGQPVAALLWREGSDDLVVEALDMGLLGLLPAHGWRLPERSGVTSFIGERSGRLGVTFKSDGPAAEPPSGPLGVVRPRPGQDRYVEAESALARGEVVAAIGAYRRAAPVSAEDQTGASRLLSLLVASRETLGEADELARAALGRWPAFVPALLARAVAASEDGRPEQAAAFYEEAAVLTDGQYPPEDRVHALVAAGREKARAGHSPIPLLERVLSLQPRHGAARRALAEWWRAQGRWDEVVGLLLQRALETADPAAKAACYAESGMVYHRRLGDPARAWERFVQAVRLCPDEPLAWEGLGLVSPPEASAPPEPGLMSGREALERALVLFAARSDREGQARVDLALATLDQAAGNDQSAMARLREAATLTPDAWEPLRRAAEVAARGGRDAEAARLWEAAFTRAPGPPERSIVAQRLALLYVRDLGQPVSARLLLERALDEAPADEGLLDQLRALLEHQGDLLEWAAFLRRALDHQPEPEGRRALLRRLRDVGRLENNAGILIDALVGLAETGGAEGVSAAIALADLTAAASDPALPHRVAVAMQAAFEQAGDEASLPRADLARRLASWREKLGDEEGALEWLRLCLEGEAEGEVAVAAWRRFVELAARRGDATATAQSLVAWADDARTGESEQARAAHLVAAAEIFRERLGLSVDAMAMLERASALDPRSETALAALEEVSAAAHDWARLAEVLERRLQVVRPSEQKPVLHRLATVLGQSLGRSDEAIQAYRRILGIDPGDRGALRALARQLWATDAKEESAQLFRRLLEKPASATGRAAAASSDRAEAHLRIAQWERVAGKATDARRHVERALAGEPDAGAPVEVVAEVMEAFGRGEELVELLRRREEAAPPEAQAEIVRARAAVLERMARSAEATALYAQLLEQTPDDTEVLGRLAEIHRREGRISELCSVSRRLWRIANRSGPGRRTQPWPTGPSGLNVEALGIELAGLLGEAGGGGEAEESPEAVLRAVLNHVPGSAVALEALGAVLDARGAHDEADEVLVRRAALETEPGAVARHLAARAQQRLKTPGGEAAALALLRQVPLESLTPEDLALRADLAEKTSEVTEALAAVGRLRMIAQAEGGPNAVIRQAALRDRMLRLAARPELPPEQALSLLEQALAADPGGSLAAESLLEVCSRLPDDAARTAALASLLRRASGLSQASRARIYLDLGESSERAGNLEGALEELEKALVLDTEPPARAQALVAHARVLLLRKDPEGAFQDLNEALEIVPDHVGALALRADFAFKAQDWEGARRSYERLWALPGASRAVGAELLAFRRAVLAEMFGDDSEAEAAYRVVADLDPQHLESREALADVAVFRGDLIEAAQRLEEVLRLLPLDAVEKLRQTRQRLGEVYAQRHEDDAARRMLELVLAEEPDRQVALDLLATVHERQGRYQAAADLCERLARVETEPAARAQALYRQGELLRQQGDLAGANDAYLRSSDLDPTFAPTLLRLSSYYWDRGDLEDLVEIGAALVGTGETGVAEAGVALPMALAAAGVGREELARAAWSWAPPDPDALAVDLGAFARRFSGRAQIVDRATAFVCDASSAELLRSVWEALAVKVAADPADGGTLRALAALSERLGEPGTVRTAYALLACAEPEQPWRERLERLGPGAAPPSALRPGVADHPHCQAPLRRALAALARSLAGFPPLAGGEAPRRQDPGAPAAVQTALAELVSAMAAPPCETMVGSAATIGVIGTRPLTLVVGSPLAALPHAEVLFFVARALEEARAGTFLTALGQGLWEVLRGAAEALGVSADGAADAGGLASEAAAWLRSPESESLLPQGEDRAALRADLEAVLARPPDLAEQLRACGWTADRLGALSCGDPLAALRALARAETEAHVSKTDPMLPAADLRREERLPLSPRARELLRFLLSPTGRGLFTAGP